MSKAIGLLILISIGTALLIPMGLHGENRTAADVLVLLETTVSPLSDPDPRDDTSIAVSPKSDQVIVGTSKVIQGGGTVGQVNSRVAYYFSSNAGGTWGNGLIGLETPQKTWGRAIDP